MTEYAKQFGVVKPSDLPEGERRKPNAKPKRRKPEPKPVIGAHKPLDGDPALREVMAALKKAERENAKKPPTPIL